MRDGAGSPGLLPELRFDELIGELKARLQAVLTIHDRMNGLLEAVVAVGSDLNMETVLRRIVEAAVGLTDARYGALGVLGEGGGLAGFVPVGLDADEISTIGDWPEGKGVLGLLMRDPRPLRVADVTMHPAASGFPAGHPPMRSFLGVPVRIRGEVFGNLYLTDKRGRRAVHRAGRGRGVRAGSLASMADRARQLGGTLRTSPADEAAGTGTVLQWRAPVR